MHGEGTPYHLLQWWVNHFCDWTENISLLTFLMGVHLLKLWQLLWLNYTQCKQSDLCSQVMLAALDILPMAVCMCLRYPGQLQYFLCYMISQMLPLPQSYCIQEWRTSCKWHIFNEGHFQRTCVVKYVTLVEYFQQGPFSMQHRNTCRKQRPAFHKRRIHYGTMLYSRHIQPTVLPLYC